jgi:protein-disulfide isomerase
MMGLAVGTVIVGGVGATLLNATPSKPEPEVMAAPAAQVPLQTPVPAQTAQAPVQAPAPAPVSAGDAAPATAAATTSVAQATAPAAEAPRTTADMLADRVLGDPAAPVTIFDYSSLTCPHCAAFHTQTLAELKKRYIDTGKVKLVYRDFPFDPAALQAAMIARCSPPERYYGFLDVLFRSQETWSRSADPAKALGQTARLAGVGEDEFAACLANEELSNGILQMRLDAQNKYDIRSTPSFVIVAGDEQEIIAGNQPIDVFADVLDGLAD